MALAWNAYGAFGTLALLLAATLAGVVYFTAPTRPQNRLLALMLALEGAVIGIGEGAMYLLLDPADAWGAQAVVILAMLPLPIVYLLFVSTLDTPLVAPLRVRGVRAGLAVAAALSPVAYFLARPLFIQGVTPGGVVPWNCVCGPGFTAALLVNGVVSLVALAPTLDAWRRAAPGSPARQQARAYAFAFGARDALFVILILVVMPLALAPPRGLEALLHVVPRVFAPATTVLFVSLLAYGILRTQLFDIDLRIKRGLGRSTIAGAFAGAFFVVSELVEDLLVIDGTVFGIAAAGAVALVLRPLRRGVDALMDKLMPSVRDEPEYVDARKLLVYRAAVESALESGDVSARERAMLGRLRAKLELDPADAARVEREVGVPTAALAPHSA